jgi:hypothetical protein
MVVQNSVDPEDSGWLIKVWFSASTFVVKIATSQSREPLYPMLKDEILNVNKLKS